MKIQLCSINAIASDVIAVAVSEATFCNQESGLPETMVIKIATDPDKIPTHVLDIPIYMPAEKNFKSASHYEMLDLFKRGDPFVAVEFERLSLHISKAGNYYGLAQGFAVVTKPYERLEDIL